MARARVDGEGGFALAVVVFLLFAIGVSAAAAYQVVFLEHRLSGFSMDADRAQVVAEAGLQRFIGDAASGIPADTAYFIDDGEAQVSSRRVIYMGPWEELHRVHSVGRVTDPRYFDAPAIREVARYARLRAPPMEVLAPLVTTAGEVNVAPGFIVDGEDGLPPPECRQRTDGWVPWYDIVAAGPIVGSGLESWNLETPAAVLAALDAPPWAALTDPAYPVDCAGPPASCSFPSGAFPVYRVTGDFTATGAQSGQGVLIVTGTLTPQASFQWNGIILSGGIANTVIAPGMVVRGMVVAGFSSPPPVLTLTSGALRFDACNVADAGRAMGVLNPEPLSWWSAY